MQLLLLLLLLLPLLLLLLLLLLAPPFPPVLKSPSRPRPRTRPPVPSLPRVPKYLSPHTLVPSTPRPYASGVAFSRRCANACCRINGTARHDFPIR